MKEILLYFKTGFRHILRPFKREPFTIGGYLNMTSDIKGPHSNSLNLVTEKCTSCGDCEKVCPTQALSIDRDRKNKSGKSGTPPKHLIVDYSKCIFCNDCVFVCPENCLDKGKEVVKGSKTLINLKVDLVDKPKSLNQRVRSENRKFL